MPICKYCNDTKVITLRHDAGDDTLEEEVPCLCTLPLVEFLYNQEFLDGNLPASSE